MRKSKKQQRVLRISTAGMIAALYTVLTVIVGSFGLANGAIQLRVSEALCVLPFFTSAAIPGLTVGCLLSNLILGCLWQDVLFGTLATLLGAIGARLLRRLPMLVPLPTVVANTVIVPLVLAYAYHVEDGLGFLFVTVGIGEVLSAYLLGMVLLSALRRNTVFLQMMQFDREKNEMKKDYQTFSITMPAQVETAIERLERAGYRAYAVGGCVRDSILGRVPNDWDITTSARPDETAACFADCRTVETGIEHGTLTVIIDGMPLEITTYRCDGEYLDNRHPVSVCFTDRIEDDLSRRDFTVNAMAYHPTRGLVDLFGGEADLALGRIRCVGDATTRFEEDGLRILRAIRFASVLDFEIENETANAVHTCRNLLSNIAAERIREEFCKLICGVGAVRILREYHDVIAVFLPEIAPCVGFPQNTKYHCYDVYEHILQSLSHTQSDDLATHLAIFLHDIGKPQCHTEDAEGGHFKGHGPVGEGMTADIMRRLRFDRATTDTVVRLVAYHDRELSAEPRLVKRLMQKMSDEDILRLIEVQRCDRLAHAKAYSTPAPVLFEIPRVMREIRAADECLSLRTLQINGEDLISLGVPKGRQIGALLQLLLDDVIDDVLPNDHTALLQAAKEKIKNHTDL